MRTQRADRIELERQLAELAEGWSHLGDEPRRIEAEQALTELRSGAASVQAGHTRYEVVPS